MVCLPSAITTGNAWLLFLFFQALLADDSLGCVDSAHHLQVLLHQKNSRYTRPRQQVIYSIYNILSVPFPACWHPACLIHSNLTFRGNLFLLTYLLFPVNVLIGVLLAAWRLIITALFNIVHMGRMDISLLNRNVEAFDPGELGILRCVQMAIMAAMLSLSGALDEMTHAAKFSVVQGQLLCIHYMCSHQMRQGFSVFYIFCPF